MYYFEYPTADTTLFEGNLSSSLNAGIDEVLEVQKLKDESGTVIQVSRILIKFDYGNISRFKTNGTIPNDAK